jgi:hypothetical protein
MRKVKDKMHNKHELSWEEQQERKAEKQKSFKRNTNKRNWS